MREREREQRRRPPARAVPSSIIHPINPFIHSAAAAAAAPASDDEEDDAPRTSISLPPDPAERSLASWAGAAEAEAAARRALRAAEEAEEARLRGDGGGRGGVAHPPPVEVEMAAVMACGGPDGGGTPPPATTTAATTTPPPQVVSDAAADLDRHFASVQDICDGVTLPSAARDLGAALAAVADVDGLAGRLKAGSGDGGQDPPRPPLSPAAKLAAWGDLRDAAFTAAVGAPWLVGGLAVALRVQLNLLGRHLFLAAHVGGERGRASPPHRPAISSAAQARLLEVGHHFVRAGAGGLLAGAVKPAAVAAFSPLDLAGPTSADDLLDRLSAAHAAVDGGVGGLGGWRALLLAADVADAATVGEPPADAALVRGMAAELATIYGSPRFAAAARAAAAAVAAQAAGALAAAVDAAGPSLPLAKAVPRAAAVGRALVDPGSPAFAEAVRVVGGLLEVRELCAAVYSCGPPL